jgi:hypothetical protein
LRFLQTDPIPGGSANTYDYANGDPVNLFDLLGLMSLCSEEFCPAAVARVQATNGSSPLWRSMMWSAHNFNYRMRNWTHGRGGGGKSLFHRFMNGVGIGLYAPGLAGYTILHHLPRLARPIPGVFIVPLEFGSFNADAAWDWVKQKTLHNHESVCDEGGAFTYVGVHGHLPGYRAGSCRLELW